MSSKPWGWERSVEKGAQAADWGRLERPLEIGSGAFEVLREGTVKGLVHRSVRWSGLQLLKALPCPPQKLGSELAWQMLPPVWFLGALSGCP